MNKSQINLLKTAVFAIIFSVMYLCTDEYISMSALVVGGVFGQYRNRIGDVVFAYRNGQQIAKSYNPKPRYTNSIEQQKSRAILKKLAQVGRQLASSIDLLVENPGEGGTKRSNFISLNHPNITYNYTTKTANPIWSNITMGAGAITPPQNCTTSSANNIIETVFDQNPIGSQEAGDIVNIFVIFQNTGLFLELENGVDISTGLASIAYTDEEIGEIVHIYAAISRPDTPKKSNTIYVGQITLA